MTTSGASASSSNGTISNGSNNSMLPGDVNDHSTGSSIHNIVSAPSMSRAASLLRKLWLHLSRGYSTWMLWVAAALNRSGEQQLACEAAAQGMLPVSCHFWNIKGIDKASAACFEALLPVLARSSRRPATCTLRACSSSCCIDVCISSGGPTASLTPSQWHWPPATCEHLYAACADSCNCVYLDCLHASCCTSCMVYSKAVWKHMHQMAILLFTSCHAR